MSDWSLAGRGGGLLEGERRELLVWREEADDLLGLLVRQHLLLLRAQHLAGRAFSDIVRFNNVNLDKFGQLVALSSAF